MELRFVFGAILRDVVEGRVLEAKGRVLRLTALEATLLEGVLVDLTGMVEDRLRDEPYIREIVARKKGGAS